MYENYDADPPVNRQVPNWFANANYNNVFEERRRQIIKWHFHFNLNKLLVPQMMDKIWESVHNRLKINYSKTYLLRNIETNKTLVWMQDRQKALGLVILLKHKQEENRSLGENINRPNTKFMFESHKSVQLKGIIDQAPLRVEEGRLPDWLCKKKGLISLDVLNDNLCMFRCLAVHRRAHKRYNLTVTRKLAKEFFTVHAIPNSTVEFQHTFH